MPLAMQKRVRSLCAEDDCAPDFSATMIKILNYFEKYILKHTNAELLMSTFGS